MSYLGTNKIGKMYLGSTPIAKAYLGSDLVFDASGGSVTPALPYDAEIEYLQATGTQYIDTGIVGNQNTRIEVKFNPSQLDTFVYGCRGDNTNSITYFVGRGDNERFGDQTYVASSTVNTLYVVIQDKTKVRINGVDHNYGTVSNFTTPYNIYLSGSSGTEYALSHLFIGRIYYMKIWSGDTLVRDFIPVRVGQVGYMYDKVNGQLFGNGGTGDFTLGNDIVEIEYLQSTGTQYINTGITIGTNTVVELKGQFTTQDSTYQTLVGSATSTDFGVMIGLQSGTGKLYIQVGQNNYALTDGSQTGLHTFTASVANSTQSLSVDGTSSSAAIVAPVSNMNMYLFARNKSTVSNFAKAKIYYCKIWNGGTLVRDFIPVRVGQVGKMYDKVSGTFFSNIGSGSFTLGNDKS